MILSIISDEDFLKKMTRQQNDNFRKIVFKGGKTVKKKFKKRKKVYIDLEQKLGRKNILEKKT